MGMDGSTNLVCYFTDFDKALKKAARTAYPNTVKHQLCVWHILKNVAPNVKKLWNGSLEGTELGSRGGGVGSKDPDPDNGDEGDEAPVISDMDSEAQIFDLSGNVVSREDPAAFAAGNRSFEHVDENIHDAAAENLAQLLLNSQDQISSRIRSLLSS